MRSTRPSPGLGLLTGVDSAGLATPAPVSVPGRSWRITARRRRAPPGPAAAVTGTDPVRPAPDVVVDAAYVKERLQSPDVKVLDVRTTMEWNNGHLPGATLILWQDLYADRRMQTFKTIDEIRALIMKNSDATAVRHAAVAAGMPTLRDDGAAKVLAGETTIEEVLRVTQEDLV